MKKPVATVVLATVLLSGASRPAFSGDLRAPVDLESAAVLPVGIRNPRIKNIVMSMETKFGGTGAIEPLGSELNKTVTWGEVLESQSGDDRVSLQGILEANEERIGDAQPGRSTGEINSFVSAQVPVLAVGVTDRWTAAVVVPILTIDISAKTGFVKNDSGQLILDEVCKADVGKCNDATRKLNDPAAEKIRTKGYEPIRSMRKTGVGDIQLVNKYQLLNDGANAFTIRGGVTLPTGSAPSPDRVVDTATGDGQTDLGFGVSYDRKITSGLKWSGGVGYTIQLPDTETRRVPEKPDTSISAKENTEDVNRDLGDVYSLGTGLGYDFRGTGFSLGAGYSYQYMSQASYSGTRFESYRYEWMSRRTPAAQLHSATLGAGFSTINFYRSGSFAVPLQVNVAYSKPLRGINAPTNDLLAAELVLFF